MAHQPVAFECFRAAGLKPETALQASRPNPSKSARMGRRSLVAAVGGMLLLAGAGWGPAAVIAVRSQWTGWNSEILGLPLASLLIGSAILLGLLLWVGSVLLALADCANQQMRRLVPATVLVSAVATLGIAAIQVLR